MSQQGGVYFRQGDGALVVPAGTKVVIQTGGLVTGNSESQLADIDDLSVTGTYGTDDDNIETAVNSIIAALRATGIIASS